MTLADLKIHVQGLIELCQLKQIRPETVEVYFVDGVLFDTPSKILLHSKRPVTSLSFAGEKRQLLLFDPTSWEQNSRAENKM